MREVVEAETIAKSNKEVVNKLKILNTMISIIKISLKNAT